MAITKVKGTYDCIGLEAQKWVKLENLFRNVCRLYNYQEVRTPIMEYQDLFHRGVGETSDIVSKETYDFMDRGNRMVTLRPEGTAGMARSYIENKIYAQGLVSKQFYIGPMFRYERPQKGRYRQFNQFGVEVYGSSDPAIDAEVIGLAKTIIEALGLKGVKVRINSLGDNESRDNYRKALVEYFTPFKDELCNDCKSRLEKNPLRILDCKVDKDHDCFKNAPIMRDYLNDESKNHFQKVLEYLESMEIEYVIDDRLVRGLDYYTHTIFEIEADIKDFGAQNVLGGGGRYDNLIESLGGPKTPSVGFAFGIERLLNAIEAENRKIKVDDFLHLFIIALGNDAKKLTTKLLMELRQYGLICDMDYQERGLKGQFKVADRLNSKYIAILGDDELKDNCINVKNTETGIQETIRISALYNYIVSDLNKNARGCGSCGGCGSEECDSGCECGSCGCGKDEE